jgi:hypothetical protein
MTASRIAGLGATLALAALASTPAAAQSFDWTFTNAAGLVTGSGYLTVGAADGGGFDVLTFAGSVDDPVAGVDGAITGFTPGAGAALSGYGFTFDNIVYPSAPFDDNLGIQFNVGSTILNIYNETGGCCAAVYPGTYPTGDLLQALFNPGASGVYGATDLGTFNLTAVPEPAAWALMLTGFAGLGAALRSRRRPLAA